MPAMNYKQATGVRARTDLSANARPDNAIEPDGERLNDEQLTRVAEWLAHEISKADARRANHVFVKIEHSRRLHDAILEVLNRPKPTP